MTKLKYMEMCLQGDALIDEIDDYIEAWHNSDSEEPIYEFLGMTEEEYGLWVENGYLLKTIFLARKSEVSINELIAKNDGERLVARAASPEEAMFISKWLVRTGRVKDINFQ